MWYVYFLRLSNDDVYVGSTNDLRRRVKSHSSGEVTSTKALLPVVLLTYVAVQDEKTARSLERYFKSGVPGKRLRTSGSGRTAPSPHVHQEYGASELVVR